MPARPMIISNITSVSQYCQEAQTKFIASEAMIANFSERAPLCTPTFTLMPKIAEWLRFKFLDNLGE